MTDRKLPAFACLDDRAGLFTDRDSILSDPPRPGRDSTPSRRRFLQEPVSSCAERNTIFLSCPMACTVPVKMTS